MDDQTRDEIDRIDGNVNGLYSIISDLREENEDLRRRLNQLEELVDPDPEATNARLEREQKVRHIRKVLIKRALDTNGRFSMKYKEVMALFDHEISPGHAYDLMNQTGNMDGFVYEQAGPTNDGQKRIRVDMDAVNDTTLVHAANKETQSSPA